MAQECVQRRPSAVLAAGIVDFSRRMGGEEGTLVRLTAHRSKANEIYMAEHHRRLIEPTLAELPFEDMSSEAEHEYIAHGVAEDIITDLSKLSGLLVIVRNSSFVFGG